MKKVSIIIPCYNVSEYIDRCIQSIEKQTIGISNLEIIVVNDASTDDTLNKLIEWEKKYPDNIVVITYDKNKKQGGARNIGIQYATSDYIGFVDSDDWIESDMYELLYNGIISNDYDVVKGKFVRELEKNENHYVNNRGNDIVYEFESIENYYWGKIENTGNYGMYGSLCTGIYKKEILLKDEMKFPENIAYEDNYWGAFLRLYTHKLLIIDKIMYHYVYNVESTSMKRNNLEHFQRCDVEIMKINKYKQLGIFNIFYKKILCEFIRLYFANTMNIIFTKFDYIPDVFSQLKNNIQIIFPDWKEVISKEDFTPEEYSFVEMLFMEPDLNIEELQIIKKDYLKI